MHDIIISYLVVLVKWGVAMGRCERCGEEFEAREPWHRLCEGCYRRRPRWHPRFVWLEYPELVLLVMLLGVILLIVCRLLGLDG